MKKILAASALLFLLAVVPSLACGPSAACMSFPMYEGCIAAAQGTKESCNNGAGPFCESLCFGDTNCTANCWTSQFSICQDQYCRDTETCYENTCFAW